MSLALTFLWAVLLGLIFIMPAFARDGDLGNTSTGSAQITVVIPEHTTLNFDQLNTPENGQVSICSDSSLPLSVTGRGVDKNIPTGVNCIQQPTSQKNVLMIQADPTK